MYIFGISCLSVASFAIIFSHSEGCLFTLLIVSFVVQISPSNEYSGLISFRINWFDLLVVQGTLKSLLQHHSLEASALQGLDSFMVQLTP